MTIKLDPSTSGIVVTCSDCPNIWFAFQFTREKAEESAIDHEERVHPESRAVRKRASNRESIATKRHAANR